jgi:hypothetical protein
MNMQRFRVRGEQKANTTMSWSSELHPVADRGDQSSNRSAASRPLLQRLGRRAAPDDDID